jgi:hypothetical protein
LDGIWRHERRHAVAEGKHRLLSIVWITASISEPQATARGGITKAYHNQRARSARVRRPRRAATQVGRTLRNSTGAEALGWNLGASGGSFGRYKCIQRRIRGLDQCYAAASEMRADVVALALPVRPSDEFACPNARMARRGKATMYGAVASTARPVSSTRSVT